MGESNKAKAEISVALLFSIVSPSVSTPEERQNAKDDTYYRCNDDATIRGLYQ